MSCTTWTFFTLPFFKVQFYSYWEISQCAKKPCLKFRTFFLELQIIEMVEYHVNRWFTTPAYDQIITSSPFASIEKRVNCALNVVKVGPDMKLLKHGTAQPSWHREEAQACSDSFENLKTDVTYCPLNTWRFICTETFLRTLSISHVTSSEYNCYSCMSRYKR